MPPRVVLSVHASKTRVGRKQKSIGLFSQSYFPAGKPLCLGSTSSDCNFSIQFWFVCMALSFLLTDVPNLRGIGSCGLATFCFGGLDGLEGCNLRTSRFFHGVTYVAVRVCSPLGRAMCRWCPMVSWCGCVPIRAYGQNSFPSHAQLEERNQPCKLLQLPLSAVLVEFPEPPAHCCESVSLVVRLVRGVWFKGMSNLSTLWTNSALAAYGGGSSSATLDVRSSPPARGSGGHPDAG